MDYRKRLQTITQAESEDRKKGEGIYYEEHHKIPAHYFANEQHPDGRNNPAANLQKTKYYSRVKSIICRTGCSTKLIPVQQIFLRWL